MPGLWTGSPGRRTSARDKRSSLAPVEEGRGWKQASQSWGSPFLLGDLSLGSDRVQLAYCVSTICFLQSPVSAIAQELPGCAVVPLVSGSVTPWTVAHKAPLSMGFPRHEYWSGLPFPTPGNLPDPEIECLSLVSCVLAGRFYTTAPPEKPCCSQALMVWKQCDQCLALPWTPSAVLFQSSLCSFNQNTF